MRDVWGIHDFVTARLVMVTGHRFGVAAFEGVFSSAAYLDGRIDVPLIIGLSSFHAKATAGFDSPFRLAKDHGCEFRVALDGTLAAHADEIKAAEPDYLLVIGWSRLVPTDILAIPRHGAIGMHPSPLPVGRGRAPIPWTIINGLTSTALTVFYLEPEADTGRIIARYGLEVRDRETSASLFARMAHEHFTAGRCLAGPMAKRDVRGLAQEGTVDVWRKRTLADSEIWPSMTAAEIGRLVRAQSGPYPRAFVSLDEGLVPVRAVSAAAVPGAVEFGCADGTAWLTRDDQ